MGVLVSRLRGNDGVTLRDCQVLVVCVVVVLLILRFRVGLVRAVPGRLSFPI